MFVLILVFVLKIGDELLNYKYENNIQMFAGTGTQAVETPNAINIALLLIN